ncbi:MAG: PilC/PilY family type IV pilus protein [Xanthomonadaceae bacterium]|nr:PilC/PilY family type IV pilus protein [Xanthomonadaceae bacterium]
MNSMHIKTALGIAAITFASALSGLAQAQALGTVDLISTPPELTAKVAPNVVLTFDDSGSMAWEYMPDQRPYDGTSWNSGHRWYCAAVIDPLAAAGTLKALPMNGMYYNPNSTYRPPLYQNGSSFPNATFTAAWDDGIRHNRPTNQSNSTTRNLSSRSFCGNAGAGYYRYTGPALTADASGKISNTSTLYTAGNWTWVALPAAQQQNFANWFSYYRVRRLAAISGTSHAFADFDHGIRVAWQNINTTPQVAAGTTILAPFQGTTRVDFYNWLFNNPASGGTPNQPAANRVGALFSYGNGVSNSSNPYYDPDTGRELACRKNFHIQMTDGMWNGGTATTTTNDNSPLPRTLPDGRTYAKGTVGGPTTIFWNEGTPNRRSMADIGFHYWATDLRPDFQLDTQKKLKVRPYLADSTTGVTGSTPLNPGDNWLDNDEVYWNPANNPATWAHLVQYMIGFGVDGTIPLNDVNLERLRKGLQAWPNIPTSDTAAKIDDMWHAAVNSRGQFFAAANPDELIEAMRRIIASVVAQSTSSTPASTSLPILTGGNSGYQGGYDTTGWPGSLRRRAIDATGEFGNAAWDAGCILTGGVCPEPVGTSVARDPNTRIIFTSDGAGVGRPFRWSSLTSAQTAALNPYGSQRVDHLRGDRSYESTITTPALRTRVSLLGAIVNGEPAYVSSPRSGYHDIFPAGSPETLAATANEDHSYAGYQNAQRARAPTVYAGSNDGMLHAFNALTGAELWAYVPNVVITNGRLKASTLRTDDLIPGVDSPAREADVFIGTSAGTGKKWRTILLGSLRLGGRGIYALDVTNPNPGSDSAVTGPNKVALWEFTSGSTPSTAGDPVCSEGATSCASLGYTYDSANVMRIRYQDKWVAVVSSGYFPDKATAAANASDINEAAASRTSLLVIDFESGRLIREIRTTEAFTGTGAPSQPANFRTFGLSTPMVFDEASDEVDDVVYAGDLAGNLWRFDLSDADKNNWTVDLMFTSYGNGGTAAAGDQPIVFNPTALRDPNTRRPILLVGTGKYLGENDRTPLANSIKQAWYGIRDYGTRSSYYPIKVNQLVTQKLDQTGDLRKNDGFTPPSGTVPSTVPVIRMQDGTGVRAQGWRIPLDLPTELGERAQRRAVPLVSPNVAVLYGLIPKSDDPCDPGARYSIIGVNAANGGPLAASGLVGGVAKSPTPPPPPMTPRGGGTVIGSGGGGGGSTCPPDCPSIIIPEIPDDIEQAINEAVPLAPWHRGAWRNLLEW